MKKILIILSLTVIFLSSCRDNLEESVEFKSQIQEDSLVTELTNPLDSNLTIVDFDSGEKTLLQNLSTLNSNYNGKPARYAYADFDADGTNEILIEFSPSGDTAIIHKEKENWVAYYRPFRALQGLKADGSSIFSYSAFESGISQLVFSSDGLIDQTVLFGDTRDEDTPVYTYNGNVISEEEHDKILSAHFEKEEVFWCEISEETSDESTELFDDYEDDIYNLDEYVETNAEDSFYSYANGYWVYLNDLGTSFEFLVVDNGFFDTGVYEGASDRDGIITHITMLCDGVYDVTVCREEYDDWYGEYLPEEITTYLFEFNGAGNLTLTNNETGSCDFYSYMGESIEDAIVLFNDEWKESNDTITNHYQNSTENNSHHNEPSVNKSKEKSYIKPDTWYQYSSNNVVRAQNAEIKSAVLISKSQVFMINYYPVCSHCSILSERIEMTGVGTEAPISEYYTCSECDKITYVRFKIQY